ncbi:MAG TPA: hypothetical protein VFY92_04560 [Hyphomicrobiaceae bacterium]|nr:hypothetical protein [Hyphomicrobiaceae bacterium]
MRAAMRAIAIALGVSLVGATAALAGPAGQAGDLKVPHGRIDLEALLEPVQYWGSSTCQRLRRACEYKEYRDEIGEGNCRRYRNVCLNRDYHCERLRRACIYKEDRDEVGEGNCRRYRRECGWY